MSRSLHCTLLMVLLASACTTDRPKAPPSTDAGLPPPTADVVATDAGARVDAGAAPPVDAGTAVPIGHVGVQASPTPVEPPPDHAAAKPAKSSIYDRILVKPKERGTDPQEVKALIEKKTGLKVELARKTAGTWVLIQLAPAPGGRSEREQQDAVEALINLGVFDKVEADRLMKVKMP